MIKIRTVGLTPDLVPYREAWALQRDLHAQIVDGRRGDTLLLLEHEAVYTAGARTAQHERPVDGTPVVDVDRGGKITWHGPGQLVGYRWCASLSRWMSSRMFVAWKTCSSA